MNGNFSFISTWSPRKETSPTPAAAAKKQRGGGAGGADRSPRSDHTRAIDTAHTHTHTISVAAASALPLLAEWFAKNVHTVSGLLGEHIAGSDEPILYCHFECSWWSLRRLCVAAEAAMLWHGLLQLCAEHENDQYMLLAKRPLSSNSMMTLQRSTLRTNNALFAMWYAGIGRVVWRTACCCT